MKLKYYDKNITNELEDLPNIAKSIAEDLREIGIKYSHQLKGKKPIELYNLVCKKAASHVDPCVLDVFMSAVDYTNGAESKPWWFYTQKRKKLYPNL